MNDLEKVNLIVEIWGGLKQLAPENLEAWRAECLASVSEDTKEFVNMAADLAAKEA